MALTCLDLCSCIGAHSIGFERAGIETVALCESNPWRREQLKKRWPKLPIFHDVRTIQPPRATITLAGPPCQQTSVAAAIWGKRSNDSLAPYCISAAIRARSRWLVIEQPKAAPVWQDQLCRAMGQAGYLAAKFEFAACDIGAPYQRRRMYFVGCASSARLAIARQSWQSAIKRQSRATARRNAWDTRKLAALHVASSDAGETPKKESAERKELIQALGDSNPPDMAEVIARMIVDAEADNA